jgi:hypothetical protein
VSNCFGFLFKLAIDELKLPASLYSKVKVGNEQTQNFNLSQCFSDEYSSKLAIILVEVSDGHDSIMKEFILAFGASINQNFTQSQLDN